MENKQYLRYNTKWILVMIQDTRKDSIVAVEKVFWKWMGKVHEDFDLLISRSMVVCKCLLTEEIVKKNNNSS